MNLDQLKQAAFEKYKAQQSYEVIYTNLFSTFLGEYDELVAKGYTRPDDRTVEVLNINLSACQVMHMIKPQALQDAELEAIFKTIDPDHKPK